MRATTWSNWTTCEHAARRAGGRRHYNAHRQLLAELRRSALVDYLWASGMVPFGRGAELARHFGVSRSTICRDLERVMRLPFSWAV